MTTSRTEQPTAWSVAWATIAAIAGVILALDLLLKSYAASAWAKKPWFPLDLGGAGHSGQWLEFSYSQNPGIAFGLPLHGWPLLVINIALILALIAYSLHSLDFRATSAKLATGLVLGGALGNLYDRLELGAVRDFLRIGIWPMFNLADTAIVVGVALLILHLYHPSHGRKKSHQR